MGIEKGSEIPEPPELSESSKAPDTADSAPSASETDQEGDAATPRAESTGETNEPPAATDKAGAEETRPRRPSNRRPRPRTSRTAHRMQSRRS